MIKIITKDNSIYWATNIEFYTTYVMFVNETGSKEKMRLDCEDIKRMLMG